MKFGDSNSNGFRDIRGAVVVGNERTNIGEAFPKSAKRDGVSPKKFAASELLKELYQSYKVITTIVIRPLDDPS